MKRKYRVTLPEEKGYGKDKKYKYCFNKIHIVYVYMHVRICLRVCVCVTVFKCMCVWVNEYCVFIKKKCTYYKISYYIIKRFIGILRDARAENVNKMSISRQFHILILLVVAIIVNLAVGIYSRLPTYLFRAWQNGLMSTKPKAPPIISHTVRRCNQ